MICGANFLLHIYIWCFCFDLYPAAGQTEWDSESFFLHLFPVPMITLWPPSLEKTAYCGFWFPRCRSPLRSEASWHVTGMGIRAGGWELTPSYADTKQRQRKGEGVREEASQHVGSTAAGAGIQELTSSTVNRGQRPWTWGGARLSVSKSSPNDILPPETIPLDPPQTAPLIGNQVCKYLSL